MLPSQKEPRLPVSLGGPHVLYDGSFILEFLQPAPELNASVLMRATYRGGHDLISLGNNHPQAPPLHTHFPQSDRDAHGATAISPWTPHRFWPVAPTHPFWSTPEGQQYESSLPNGRNSDTTRVAMTPRVFATLFSLQTVSELSMVMVPTAWWLGPLRWRVPWAAPSCSSTKLISYSVINS
ncbi:hypothetical protein BJX66DRAFT_330943 [Aspergillus keveii]|uniref:Uncharacterized protein n=1 Tax=Aspergillus keveii TaxID=714993 RepID=A0ABR4FI56_9EURO